jgi:hypothetical protein
MREKWAGLSRLIEWYSIGLLKLWISVMQVLLILILTLLTLVVVVIVGLLLFGILVR